MVEDAHPSSRDEHVLVGTLATHATLLSDLVVADALLQRREGIDHRLRAGGADFVRVLVAARGLGAGRCHLPLPEPISRRLVERTLSPTVL